MTMRIAWSEDETLMAFVLYLMLPPNEADDTGTDVQNLARVLGRTPSAVAMKIWNIAAHDKNRVALGKTGLSHGSKRDAEIWEQFEAEGDSLLDRGLTLLNQAMQGQSTSPTISYAFVEIPEGKERFVRVNERVNQNYFRNSLLKNYRSRCCVTGLDIPQLLVASHIKPWSKADPKTERLAPSNGLLLNALHDRAFDKGLITIRNDYTLVLSQVLKHADGNTGIDWLKSFEGATISMPEFMPPDSTFIEYHNDMVFLG